MTELDFALIKKHNQLRKECRAIAEVKNTKNCWDDYFKSYDINKMEAFIQKYKGEKANV